MAKWMRYRHADGNGFGALEGERVHVFEGSMFDSPRPTGRRIPLAEVAVDIPCVPTKMIALWNNFHQLAEKLGVEPPSEPLYLLKSNNSFAPQGSHIERPGSYPGKVVFEGELGIVIGRRCRSVDESTASECIFGYTCVNDVTAAELIQKDSTFAQWVRAKGFDTFGPFGPVIATDADPSGLRVRTLVNGDERQNYPVDDMIFPPARLVSLLSRDCSFEPGDVIACGTSVGVGSMKPGSLVEVAIDGVGTLVNSFD